MVMSALGRQRPNHQTASHRRVQSTASGQERAVDIENIVDGILLWESKD